MVELKEYSILLLVLICIFIYINFLRKNMHLDFVKSTINNQSYYVRKLPDKQEAADQLAILSKDLLQLINYVKTKDREGVDRLAKNFDTDIITENIPGSTYTAYSVNKGEELSICIREAKTEKFIDRNTVNFVAIHELAHIMTKSSGHTPEFWDNMKYLLEQASEIGIYTPIDYSKDPASYCGERIDSTPMDL